jgi:hypothetical protein
LLTAFVALQDSRIPCRREEVVAGRFASRAEKHRVMLTAVPQDDRVVAVLEGDEKTARSVKLPNWRRRIAGIERRPLDST